MKVKMWEIGLGNNWNKYVVVAQNIKQAIAKAEKKAHNKNCNVEDITKVELIATED